MRRRHLANTNLGPDPDPNLGGTQTLTLTRTLTPTLTLTRCAAAIWLALKTRGELPWSAALAQHSTYTEADLQPCVRDLHGLHCEAASSRLQAVYMKYARWECRSVSCIKPVCAAQLDLAPQWWEKAARGRRQGERG